MVWIGAVGGDVVGVSVVECGSGNVLWTGGTWGRGQHSVGRVVRPTVGSVESEKKNFLNFMVKP